MARGSDGKAARNEARKEKREKEKEDLAKGEGVFDINADEDEDPPLPTPTSGNNDEDNDEPIKKKSKRKKSKNAQETQSLPPPAKSGIKMGPLVLLVMLTGTTLLPALLYAGDWFGAFLGKNHVLGSLGHKLGVGPSPKKRVYSFYEKHDPVKIDDVESILGKYYGEYPKLIKRLERKYGDHGYFIDWEKDEAPMTLAMDKVYETRDYMQKQFNIYAPQQLKVATRNIKYNVSTLYRKGKRLWKKHVWPVIEPVFGVPDGGAAQKRKDRAEAQDKQGRRKKNAEHRDD